MSIRSLKHHCSMGSQGLTRRLGRWLNLSVGIQTIYFSVRKRWKLLVAVEAMSSTVRCKRSSLTVETPSSTAVTPLSKNVCKMRGARFGAMAQATVTIRWSASQVSLVRLGIRRASRCLVKGGAITRMSILRCSEKMARGYLWTLRQSRRMWDGKQEDMRLRMRFSHRLLTPCFSWAQDSYSIGS